jgi:hypothetical protein
MLPLNPFDVVDAGLPTWISPRRWTGSELFGMPYAMLFMFAISVAGDIDMVRWAGEGVETGDCCVEPCSPSERVLLRLLAAVKSAAPRAKASAVALAASSRVPVW